MIKTQYLQELTRDTGLIKKGQQNNDVKKVQEWLNLWKYYDSTNWKVTGVGIDGIFGAVTEEAVRAFQKTYDLGVDGIVGDITWAKLTEPMSRAYTVLNDQTDLRALITAYAHQHLASSPREFNQNEGTWVRAYMDGYEGAEFAWCMGFAQTVLDQATSAMNQKFTTIMPATYNCDVVGTHGLSNGQLIENAALTPGNIEPGDFFLIVKTPQIDWTHVGIITNVDGDWIETIEGNTNDEGSREGYEVCARKRNYKTSAIDVFKVQ